MPNWDLFFKSLILFEIFVLIQGFLSWKEGFLTHEQMFSTLGIRDGDAFIEHGGMWADVFVISPIISYILAVPHRLGAFSVRGYIVLLAVAVFWYGALMYFAALSKSRPEAHAYKGKITAAGFVHLWFAVLGTWIIVLFYFSHPPLEQLVVISCLLTPFFHLGARKFNAAWRWNRIAIIQTICGPVAVWAWTFWRCFQG